MRGRLHVPEGKRRFTPFDGKTVKPSSRVSYSYGLQAWRRLVVASHTQPLSVFDGGLQLFLVIRKGSRDRGVKPPELVFKRRATLCRQKRDEVVDKGPHSPHDLHTRRP